MLFLWVGSRRLEKSTIALNPDNQHGLVQVDLPPHKLVTILHKVKRVRRHVRVMNQHAPTPKLTERSGVLLRCQSLKVWVRNRVLPPAPIHHVFVASKCLQLQRQQNAGAVDEIRQAGLSTFVGWNVESPTPVG